MSVKNKINSINLWLKKNTSIDEQILSIKKFETGQSNPTFLLKSDNKSFVLRSKPLGNLLRGAHRIDREYKVMSALSNSKIPTPKMYGYCSDEDITGSEFYVMEFINGAHEFNPDLTNYTSEQRDKIYKHKIKILAELVKLDLKKIGLENFGKPYGYLERQIKLWIKQYRDSETKHIKSMEYLINTIPKYVPTEIDNLKPCLLHGDFRLDNMILEKNKSIPRIIGLLDWELSTLSPPFIDLSYWVLMLRFEKTWPIGGLSNFNNQKSYSGIPTEEKILESYLNLTSLDKPKYWKFLLAFNCFRFAGILQGIAKRVIDGNNSGENAYEVGEQAEPVADLGSKILKEYL